MSSIGMCVRFTILNSQLWAVRITTDSGVLIRVIPLFASDFCSALKRLDVGASKNLCNRMRNARVAVVPSLVAMTNLCLHMGSKLYVFIHSLTAKIIIE